MIGKTGADYFILDLSYNGGGNPDLIDPLLKGIRKNPVINRKGHLYVILGSGTYSAAVQNAIAFRTETEALLVGNPTRGNGNHYGNTRYLVLPRTGLKIRTSTRFYDFPGETTAPLQPDIPLDESTLEEAIRGKDALMDALRGIIESRQ